MTVKPWMLHLAALMGLATLVLEPFYGPDSVPLIIFAVAMAFCCRRAIIVLSRGNARRMEAVRHRHFV